MQRQATNAGNKSLKHLPGLKSPVNAVAAGQVPLSAQRQFVSFHRNKQTDEALKLSRQLTRDYPKGTFAWKALGSSLLRDKQLEDAATAFRKALELTQSDPEIHNNLGHVLLAQDRSEEAIAHIRKAVELKPDFIEAVYALCDALSDKSRFAEVVSVIDSALDCQGDNIDLVGRKARALLRHGDFAKALDIFQQLLNEDPKNPTYLHGVGNAYYNLGRFNEAETFISRGIELAPQAPLLLSDYLLQMHYNPAHSMEVIHAAHLDWNKRFCPEWVERADSADKNPERRIRIGMISAGFRIHPVGQMISSALHFLPREDIEIFAYTMNNKVDPYTTTIKQRADSWQNVSRMTDQELDEQIRSDRIDILVDLCGHTEGSRSVVMAMAPAPLQVKWVGGQINTTGIAAMDYMLSDSIETPPGVDKFYVEKLIRMPDDYICYVPRSDTPAIGPLPAQQNGFITFGCFNNPTKVNEVIIEHWASLLNEIPNSKLFMKGAQYDSDDMVNRIRTQFESLGVSSERLIIEERSPHVELLDAYNRVDIALDPWPYSGGLTTCEALMMGVPVITLPGPTFAGRHSATHLVNAGLADLVVNDWDEYRYKAVALAGDIETLSELRRNLRRQLQQSPVCDAHRFGHHLNVALRAIWQRYCDDQPAAALTFDKTGAAYFEGAAQPVTVNVTKLPDPRTKKPRSQHAAFEWELPRQIVAIDNGGTLFRDPGFENLRGTSAFALIGFDPRSQVKNPDQYTDDRNVACYPHAVLGNGQPASLHACLDPEWSSTLEPEDPELLPQSQRSNAVVLTKLPISTVALDEIQGIEPIDWLILDQCSHPVEVMQHGQQALSRALFLQVSLSVQPRYRGQATIGQVMETADKLGFQLYCLNNSKHRHSQGNCPFGLAPTQLESTEILFIPSQPRMLELDEDQRRIFAFLADKVFNLPDLAYHQLDKISPEVAQAFLGGRRGAVAAGESFSPKRSSMAANTSQASATPPPASSLGTSDEETFALPSAPHMSSAERALFRHALKTTTSYFEFGAGGSTVWAIEQGLEVKGVESDPKWVDALIESLGPKCKLEAVDIGPTGDWGMPTSRDYAERFPAYSRSIESHEQHFDLILVDGRFRVACTMKAIENILRYPCPGAEARLFIHDFWNRPQYHSVLQFLEVQDRVDSAGIFKLKPDLQLNDVREHWLEYAEIPH